MPIRRDGFLASLGGAAYTLLFAYLSGGVQVFELPGFEVSIPTLALVYFESQAYTGPGLQLFWGGSMVSVRLLVLLLGLLISLLVSINIYFLLKLSSRGLLRACLMRGAGTGLAMLLSSIASATYLCCGWAPTVALLGISLASSLGLTPAVASAALLTLNALILHKRLT